jgi:hypothetical protein
MVKRLALVAVLCGLSMPAAAADPGGDAYMIRVMKCVGAGANMELYLPQSLIFKGYTSPLANVLSMPPTIGWYVLDLSDVSKGKSLEPVRISIARDKKSLIVDQYTRGLPPTRIPITGGTVDFDQRFGTGAKCSALNWDE